jgi:hypothetical protein
MIVTDLQKAQEERRREQHQKFLGNGMVSMIFMICDGMKTVTTLQVTYSNTNTST